MIMSIAGEARFQAGLQLYLKRHAYANAESEDLWEALEEEVELGEGMALPHFARAWTQQEGHPLLTVALDADKGALSVAQERFLYLHEEETEAQRGELWPVFVTYFSDLDGEPKSFWLNDSSKTHRSQPTRSLGRKGGRWTCQRIPASRGPPG